MSVLIDSVIWSLALRRKTASAPQVQSWSELVRQSQALMLGAVRQEVLTGIREQSHYRRIRDLLRPFPDLVIATAHYERAAQMSNVCRSHGIQGSPTDFLLCAVSEIEQMSIFTTDNDFAHFSRLLPITLYRP